MRTGAALATLLVVLVVAACTLPSVADAAGAGCSTEAALDAPAAAQERAMLCLTNRARGARGLGELSAAEALTRAADHKSADILRCDSFSHEACGREFTYWIERFGFDGCASAENIAWGSGRLGGVRSIFQAWMRSPGHRENILGPYGEIGVGLRVGKLKGHAGARVWTQDFATPCRAGRV